MPLYNRRPALPTPAPPAPLGLAELLGQVRVALLRHLPDTYWLVAEVADITRPRTAAAHCYFTLSEQGLDGRGVPVRAQARATLWSSRYAGIAARFERHTGQPLRAGLRLLLQVQVRFHEQYGLSLDVLAIDPSYTVGELARQRLLTLEKLTAKGLLARQAALPLALAPQRLAVISAPTAAGYQDFMQQLREAPYDFAVALFPAAMQGDEAPASIRAALAAVAARRAHFDAVVLIRGGGGKADLLAFDDYGLAAAIGAFALPVLTGIGHERDEAVADLAAHRALKTPTAVAVFLVERLARLEAVLHGYGGQIGGAARRHLARHGQRLAQLRHRAQAAAAQPLAAARAALQQRVQQAAQAPRARLRRFGQALHRLRQQLPRAARRALAREQRTLRQRSRALLQRFQRHHRRRREDLLRRRFRLHLAAAALLHRAEVKVLTLRGSG